MLEPLHETIIVLVSGRYPIKPAVNVNGSEMWVGFKKGKDFEAKQFQFSIHGALQNANAENLAFSCDYVILYSALLFKVFY